MTPDFFMPNSYLSIHIKCIVAPLSDCLSPLTFIVLSHPMRQFFFNAQLCVSWYIHLVSASGLAGCSAVHQRQKASPSRRFRCDRTGLYKLLKIYCKSFLFHANLLFSPALSYPTNSFTHVLYSPRAEVGHVIRVHHLAVILLWVYLWKQERF